MVFNHHHHHQNAKENTKGSLLNDYLVEFDRQHRRNVSEEKDKNLYKNNTVKYVKLSYRHQSFMLLQ